MAIRKPFKISRTFRYLYIYILLQELFRETLEIYTHPSVLYPSPDTGGASNYAAYLKLAPSTLSLSFGLAPRY